MRTKSIIILFTVLLLCTNCFPQSEIEEKKAIKEIILEAYLGGAYNDIDTKAMRKGFHDSFTTQVLKGNMYRVQVYLWYLLLDYTILRFHWV